MRAYWRATSRHLSSRRTRMLPQARTLSPKSVQPPQKPEVNRTQEARTPQPSRSSQSPGHPDASRFEAPQPKPVSLDGAPRVAPPADTTAKVAKNDASTAGARAAASAEP